jgi:hypothetical protein
MFHFLLGSVLPEFDYYLAIYAFLNFQQQFRTHGDKDLVQTAQLYIFLSA